MGLTLGAAVIGMAVAAESPRDIDNPATANPALQNRAVQPPRDQDTNRDRGFREDRRLGMDQDREANKRRFDIDRDRDRNADPDRDLQTGNELHPSEPVQPSTGAR
jgi:hypothetical protein